MHPNLFRLLLCKFVFSLTLVSLVSCSGKKPSLRAQSQALVPAGILTMLEGQINQKPAKFIVDTGAPHTLLALQEAQRLGVEKGKQIGISGGLGGVTSRYSGIIDYWKFAGREGGPTFVMLQNMPFAEEQNGPDGLAGLDLLQGLNTIIDYRERLGYGKLIIDADGKSAQALRQLAKKENWHTIALTRIAGEQYHLMPIVLAGKERNWIVDTGAQRGLITEDFASKIGIPVQKTPNRIVGATGLLNGVLQANNQWVGLPNGTQIATNLIVINSNSLGIAPPKSIQYGLIGVDILNAAGAIYDIGNAVIYLPQNMQ